MQPDKDPKQTSRCTSEWLKGNKVKVLELCSQSVGLNLTEMQAVYAGKLSSVTELKQLFKDEGAKTFLQQRKRLITSNHKHLIAVLATKDGPTCDKFRGAITFTHE